MNFEIIKSYIQNPREIFNDPDTLALKEVLQKYPYFATAHLLQEIAQNQKESIFCFGPAGIVDMSILIFLCF